MVHAAKLARAKGQLVAWDKLERDYAIALYLEQTHQLQPLSDEQTAILINGDPVISSAWRKWNAASGNRGSLIVLDSERAFRVLRAATNEPDDDNEMKGLA